MRRRKTLVSLSAVALIGAVSALGSTGSAAAASPRIVRAQSPQPNAVTVYSITPTETDPSITGPANPNLAMTEPLAQTDGKLVVYLPGTGAHPDDVQLFLQNAASIGFQSIGLQYDNQDSVGDTCSTNLACYGTVRQNKFDGTDPSSFSAIPVQDGVESRLAALLSYLTATYPGEGWGRYLTGSGQPRWGVIVLSGGSQGGGEAAFIGAEEPLSGEVLMSSPVDSNPVTDKSATWLSTVPTGQTPLSRISGFDHTGDTYRTPILGDWTTMGLDTVGPLTTVDTLPPPYGDAQELSSNAALPTIPGESPGTIAHSSPDNDLATPLCPDGTPEYTPVWTYMLQVAGGLTRTSGQAGCGSGS
jgi:hypothetical protein